MKAFRVRTQLTSETLHLPELSSAVGKNVEIIILEEDGGTPRPPILPGEFPLRGSVLYDEDPLAPVAEEDWEALQ